MNIIMAKSLLLVFIVLQAAPADRVIGLLRLPEVWGPDTCVPYRPIPITVRASATPNAQRIATIEVVKPMQVQADGGCTSPVVRVKHANNKDGEPPSEEIGYEVPASLVYERSGRWYRIALDEGSGWIQIDDPERFISYENLVVGDERLPYVSEIFDGRLFSAADRSASAVQLPKEWTRLLGKPLPYVKVLSSQTRNGELWFHIRLTAENACTDVPADLPKVEGWIPAYASTKRIVWFYSRGC